MLGRWEIRWKSKLIESQWDSRRAWWIVFTEHSNVDYALKSISSIQTAVWIRKFITHSVAFQDKPPGSDNTNVESNDFIRMKFIGFLGQFIGQ